MPSASAHCTHEDLMAERGSGPDAAHHAFAPSGWYRGSLPDAISSHFSYRWTGASLLPAGESGWDKAVSEHPCPSGSGV